MSWLFLSIAILTEVGATLSLRMLSQGEGAGRPRGSRLWWAVPTVAGYLLAFTALSLCLQAGLTIGVAYGVWTAAGVVLTAIAGRFLFNEPFTWIMGAGVALIVGGVLLIELGSHPVTGG